MTASISVPARAAGRITSDRLAGFGPLFRKELREWAHSNRIWVILASTTAFMALTAANGAITSWIVANAPDGEAPDGPISLDLVFNFLNAVSTQFFVVVAIFAAMSLLVAERDRGTLSWVASKPVSRVAIWLSKWTAAAIVVSLVVGVIPLAATFGLAIVLYGPAGFDVFAFAVIGVVASITFMVAVVLGASVVVSNQAAVAAIGFVVLLLPPMLASLLPVDISPVLPFSILPWALSPVIGAEMNVVTPIAWAISLIAVVGLAARRMERLEF
jgi:ABC-type transport system involved in multi-copper enzyme maturation permease subunit